MAYVENSGKLLEKVWDEISALSRVLITVKTCGVPIPRTTLLIFVIVTPNTTRV